MSTWWRACRSCGGLGDDVRRCPYCGEWLPFGSANDPSDDWRLLTWVGLFMILLLAVILLLGLALLPVTR